MQDSNSAGTTETRRAQWRAVGAVLLLCAATGVAALGWWWLVSSRHVTTDNAQIANGQILVLARISGTVASVHGVDTQRVKAGDLLIEINPVDAEVALEQARAALARAVREVVALRASAAQAQATVTVREIILENAERDYQSRRPLQGSGALAPELLRHARAQVSQARGELAAAREQARAAATLAGDGGIGEHPLVQVARADHLRAWLTLGRTRVYVPVDGVIAQRVADPGEQVIAGAQMMRVIPATGFWIDANLKETQLRNVRVGQPVSVTLDLYGGARPLSGRVAGISGGTGATFALLPPQNAAGNWVKVVQRIPVRIELDDEAQSDDRYPLFVGLSAHVSIDTRDRTGPMLQAFGTAKVDGSGFDDYGDHLSQSQAEAEFRAILAASASSGEQVR
jgi:membrane fusion protein, multidrug efflux system